MTFAIKGGGGIASAIMTEEKLLLSIHFTASLLGKLHWYWEILHWEDTGSRRRSQQKYGGKKSLKRKFCQKFSFHLFLLRTSVLMLRLSVVRRLRLLKRKKSLIFEIIIIYHKLLIKFENNLLCKQWRHPFHIWLIVIMSYQSTYILNNLYWASIHQSTNWYLAFGDFYKYALYAMAQYVLFLQPKKSIFHRAEKLYSVVCTNRYRQQTTSYNMVWWSTKKVLSENKWSRNKKSQKQMTVTSSTRMHYYYYVAPP